MNMYTITKRSKKFILVLVLLILFNFCYPKNVKAGLVDDIVAAPAKIFWILEEGILIFLNNIFTNPDNKTKIDSQVDENGVETTTIDVKLTPDNIIKGRFILFDANIFREITNDSNYLDYVEGGSVSEGKKVLRETIAGWYYALRNFAIIALLSVLVYVGIRMIMSTVAQDKAKYKVMFKDWLVALCLVVVMHYIMIGILNISSMITDALGGGENVNMVKTLSSDITGILGDKDYDVEGIGTLSDAYAKILVLAGIIIYTFIFAVKYLKREFTIIFLILLGPVSCITYPIDKISDGKAQAFNKWFSEFLYQVIIQPFHLLLYIVLIGSATVLADANVIYALICFAVMIPAEKFIKEMFGFKDKLGSPLGAIASTALASKAISALTSKGKGAGGSGGKDDGGDNNSTPNELPPRTVDKSGLVSGTDSGEGNTGRGTVEQQENQALESGEEPGGSASAADAYQNSDDPVADAERAALEEQIADGQLDEDDLTDEQKALLGIGQQTERNQQGNTEQNSQGNNTNNQNDSQSKWEKFKSVHNQRVSKKYGSTSRGQIWINRGKKIAPKLLKGAGKAALIGGLGAIATTGALLTGNGKEALGIAAGIGAYAGKKAISGGKKAIKGAKGAVKDYYNKGAIPFLNPDQEKQALKATQADSKKMDRAVLSYRKNHGGEPTYEDLEKEMNDRFALSRYGLSDDQIDNAIGSFQELRDSGIDENDALNQTAYCTKLADDYSKKDYRTKKTMEEARDAIASDFEKHGVKRDVAERYAEKYLRQSAKIKGVEEIALPSTSQTVDIPINRSVSRALGVELSDDYKGEQVERVNQLNIRLQDMGYSDSEITLIASSCANSRATGAYVIDTYEAKVEYLENGEAQNQAKLQIESMNGGKNATAQEVRTEMKERLVLKSTFNIQNEQEVSSLRNLEATELKEKTQIQAAREFAIENKGQLNNEARMATKKQQLVDKLIAGGSSREKALKDAGNIINMAINYNNEIKVDKNASKTTK